jgi:hypothetical protein
MLADEESSKPPGLTEMKVVPQREDREVHPALLVRKEEREKGGGVSAVEGDELDGDKEEGRGREIGN